MMHSLLADALLVLHFAFIAFVVGGQGFIVIGWFRSWRGVRSIWFRAAHLLAIGVVAAQAWVGAWCPLTLWENQLRVAAGQSPYSGTFIQHWFGGLVYYDAPAWAFTAAYTLFGAIVLATWILVPPRRPRPSRP
jgi:hypothetical protein